MVDLQQRRNTAMKRIFVVAISIVFFASATVQSRPAHAENHPLWQMYTALKSKKWVDSTQTFDTDTPHWKVFQAMTRKVLFDYDKDGFRAEEYCHVGQWGTHVDPPTHFHKGLRSQDQIDVKEMLMPLVVLDVHAKVAANPDYVFLLQDVRRSRVGSQTRSHSQRGLCRNANRLVQALARYG